MIAEQEQCTRVQNAIQASKLHLVPKIVIQPAVAIPPKHNDTRLFEFAANAPTTLAERHPHLTVFAISAAVLLAAIAAEIDCLSGSGYFWR